MFYIEYVDTKTGFFFDVLPERTFRARVHLFPPPTLRNYVQPVQRMFVKEMIDGCIERMLFSPLASTIVNEDRSTHGRRR